MSSTNDMAPKKTLCRSTNKGAKPHKKRPAAAAGGVGNHASFRHPYKGGVSDSGGGGTVGGGKHKPKKKIDKRMKMLFKKRARNYNSDNSDDEQDNEEEEHPQPMPIQRTKPGRSVPVSGNMKPGKQTSTENEEVWEDEDDDNDGEEENGVEVKGGSEDEEDMVELGLTKFSDGCRAFNMAFKAIMHKSVPDVVLGPVLSGQSRLVAEKLAEEVDENDRKVKGEVKKQKHLVAEKGHNTTLEKNFLDSHEKFLIGVATKGVVKLFNAVNKAQHAQKGLNPSRAKDAKVLGKRRREAFLSEIRNKSSKGADSRGKGKPVEKEDDEPAWAPLRDSYMLTSNKLKNWDKMPNNNVESDTVEMLQGSSDDED